MRIDTLYIEDFKNLLRLDWFKQSGILLDPKNMSFKIQSKKIYMKNKKEENNKISIKKFRRQPGCSRKKSI